MGSGDLAGDKRQGRVAPARPFEPVGVDQNGMGDAAPFAHHFVPVLRVFGVDKNFPGHAKFHFAPSP